MSESGPRLRLSVPAAAHVPIDSEEFSEMVKESPLTGGFGTLTVIDVRDADFEGGHIAGSLHRSFEDLEGEDASKTDAKLAEIVEAVRKANVQKIVFVCLYGKQRSPVVAESFLAKCKSMGVTEPATFVLNKGFAGVLNAEVEISSDKQKPEVKSGSKLIADFDASKWTVISVPRTPSNSAIPASQKQLAYKKLTDSAQIFLANPV
jgi:rhodanese-related sulfurtransferase